MGFGFKQGGDDYSSKTALPRALHKRYGNKITFEMSLGSNEGTTQGYGSYTFESRYGGGSVLHELLTTNGYSSVTGYGDTPDGAQGSNVNTHFQPGYINRDRNNYGGWGPRRTITYTWTGILPDGTKVL